MAKQNARPNRLHKAGFYAANALSGALPWAWWSQQRDRLMSELESLTPSTRADIMARVRYYNRLHQTFAPAPDAESIRSFSPRNKSSAYYFDLRNVIRYFPRDARVAYQLGDVTRIPEHQFIVSVEGIDVATNLKWIMASNSLCLMRRPRFETWFMEGTLQPDIHYVQLKDDFSDLEQKVTYYREHPSEAKRIITNAQQHAARFSNHNDERLISLLVIDRYLRLSGQI